MTRTHVLAATRTIGIAILGISAFIAPAYAMDDDDDQYGAYLYEGTCDNIGSNPLEDIGDLEPEDDAWNVIGQGEPSPGAVYGEDEDLSQAVSDLTASDYVVVVRERDDQNSPVVACGMIDGSVDANGELVITLDEVNGSGVQGRAHFGPEDEQDRDDDEQTEVTVGVWKTGSGTQAATPSN